MKKQSDETTELILKAATEEFLKYGYVDASLRRIASACNVSTHTIYTRFDDKEGLFDAIVSEAAENLKEIHIRAFDKIEDNSSLLDKESEAVEGTNDVLNFIYNNFEIFKIIFCKSAGTKYEHYLDSLANTEEQFYKKMIGTIYGKDQKLSDFFIHAICSGAFKPIYEVVAHDLTLEEAAAFLEMQEKYNFAGWEAILNFNK